MAQELCWWSVWAKSERDDRCSVTGWLPLHQHLDDSAGVAGLLVDEWVSRQVLVRIAEDLPDGVAGVRRLASWLAAVHDVGKCSPAFAVQVDSLSDQMRDQGLVVSPLLAVDPQRRKVGHALVGFVSVRDWLVRNASLSRRVAATQLAAVVGGHHGLPPEDGQLALVASRPDLAGREPWSGVRDRILDRAAARAGGVEWLAAYRDVRLSKPSQVLLTAIVILADWIASNAELFELRPFVPGLKRFAGPDDAVTAERLKRAWAMLELPPRWEAAPAGRDVDVLFRSRFPGKGAQARPVQVAAVESAGAQAIPGMVIVEAPMGAGKTEAALLAAEVLAHRSGANGCFVALPTQATSDAMFDRVMHWLDALPKPANGAPVTVTLAHGKAALNDTFSGLVRNGRFASVGDEDDPCAVIAHQWLIGRKKSVLASFVVGTIDQVLFAGLKSKHLMLRHLGLAGKVVIIDEVHAYDVYMSQYLHRVVQWLGAYRVPVVLLSATLPVDRRQALLAAYESGRGVPSGGAEAVAAPGYPVVVSSGGLPPRAVALPPGRTPVRLDRLDDDLDSLVAYLKAHLVNGGCAAVVRNTVTRVQETAERLEREFGADRVTVNHSRFLACDRARTDRDLLRRFGPPGSGTARPDLHIVVASQVLEQSLDVDFDLLVTDLAPVDLVLQRMGRLHRHERDRPAPLRAARCALTGVRDWAAAPVLAVPGSRRVYGDHPLLRAAALLADRDTVELPTHIADLVQRAYGPEPLGPDPWQPAMREAAVTADRIAVRRAERAQAFLLGEVGEDTDTLVGWVRAGVGDVDDSPDGVAQVRDGEENLEVLVVQRDTDGGLLTPSWIERGAARQIPTDQPIPAGLARVIAACSLRLPLALSHPGVIDDVIGALERNSFTSFTLSPLLAGQLVLVLDQDGTAVVEHGKAHFALTYDTRRGLLHDRR